MKFTGKTGKRKNRLGVKGADFYLIAALLVITAGLLVWIQFAVKKQGETVIIKVDGTVVKQLALNSDTELDITGYQGGINHIVIQDHTVYMSYADCPDVLCVHTGKISKTGETIVCLPHRVVVEIIGAKEAYDSVVQ